MSKIIMGVIVVLVVIIGGNMLLPVPMAAIEIAPEPIGLGPITNSLFTSIILSVILIIGSFVLGRNLKETPSGVQNVVEWVIETLSNFVNEIAPKKWIATFFPILATIFIFLLCANYFSLLTPLLGSFGIVHSTQQRGMPMDQIIFVSGSSETVTPLHTNEAKGETKTENSSSAKQGVIVPLFRAPTSDLNLTLALALISVFLTQYFGVKELGLSYFGKFFQFSGFAKKGVMMGLIDVFVGLLELISEFAKILSFGFRLFGNIFAGEVLLIIMSSLVTLFVVVVFFGLELFVGLIQAFVFFILSLVFFSMATQPHGEHSEH